MRNSEFGDRSSECGMRSGETIQQEKTRGRSETRCVLVRQAARAPRSPTPTSVHAVGATLVVARRPAQTPRPRRRGASGRARRPAPTPVAPGIARRRPVLCPRPVHAVGAALAAARRSAQTSVRRRRGASGRARRPAPAPVAPGIARRRPVLCPRPVHAVGATLAAARRSAPTSAAPSPPAPAPMSLRTSPQAGAAIRTSITIRRRSRRHNFSLFIFHFISFPVRRRHLPRRALHVPGQMVGQPKNECRDCGFFVKFSGRFPLKAETCFGMM